ncbi:hypothetical protein ACIOG8_08060 [Streptomyces erythrochromogenes]|uniref:hypothetical protein n=1 Tax=Streptomyces erythrochromogenes TaxID=285574 RepID=UPI00381D03A4
MPDRGRWRNAVNLLLCTAGVGGVVFGGWALHDTYTTHQNAKASRALITRACAGLADADAVMRLDGGTDRVVLGGDEPRTVDFEGIPDSCVLSRVEERHGREVQIGQFTLDITGLPQERALHTVEDFPDEPFTTLGLGSQGDMTARTRLPDRMPLGDGRLGDYGPDDVTVVARCEQPAEAGTTTLIVTATSPNTRDEAGDRPVLARLARQAAVGAAAKYGCRAQLPELPDRLPEPVVDLGPAAGDRSDSCGWYAAHLRTADGGTLPDRAAGVPLGGAAREEGCLLAVGPEATRRIHPTLGKEQRAHLDLDAVLRISSWWVRTRSYFGDDAAAFAARAPGRRIPDPVAPGTAGRLGDVLHGSATCQGRPATLTMTVPYRYRSVLGARLDELFTAYATDAAARRGCTGLVLPPPE